MTFNIYKPSPWLRPMVKHYWEMKVDGGCGIHYQQKIIPEGLAELVFYLGTAPAYTGTFGEVSKPIVFSGQQDKPYVIDIKNSFHLFAVVFQPSFSSGFFNHAAHLLHNQVVDAQLLGNSKLLSNLYARLQEAKNTTSIIQEVELELAKWLQQINYEKYIRIEDSIKFLTKNYGSLKVPELASRACLSRKQFERQFLQVAGLSPAAFSRIVRFQYALHLKNQHNHLKLTELGLHAGYYDQSHMIREFKQISGMLPRTLFAEGSTSSDFYLE